MLEECDMNKLPDFFMDIVLNDTNETRSIRLTDFINGESNLYSSLDEKLTCKENSQLQFTFSMYKKIGYHYNPYIPYLVNDRTIRLVYNGEEYHLIITNVVPSVTNDNVKYTYTCQDEFSYSLSRRNLNTRLTTDDSADYEDTIYAGIWGELSNCGPKPVDVLVNKLFDMCNISDWVLDPLLNRVYIPFYNNLYSPDEIMKVSFDASGTPFNILVELAKVFNGIITIDYTKKPHVISFLNKELIQYNGFSLKPDFNLNKFSYSSKGDNLCNIMHVVGQEDGDGNLVSMVPTIPTDVASLFVNTLKPWPVAYEEKYCSYPIALEPIGNNDYTLYYKGGPTEITIHNLWTDVETADLYSWIQQFFPYIPELNTAATREYVQMLNNIPHAGSFLYDFSYWKENGLITEAQYNELLSLFNKDLRNINLQISLYQPIYTRVNSRLSTDEQKINNYVVSAAAEDHATACREDTSTDMNFSCYDLTVKENGTDYFKIWEGDVVYGVDNTIMNLTYGSIGNTLIDFCLPDFPAFVNAVSNHGRLYFKERHGTAEEYSTLTTITRLSSFLQETNTDNNILKVDWSVPLQDVSATYHIQLFAKQNNQDFNCKNIETIDNVDALGAAVKRQALDNLQKLVYTVDYIQNQLTVNGADWLEKKKNEIKLKKQDIQKRYDDTKAKIYKLLNKTESELSVYEMLQTQFSAELSYNVTVYPAFCDLKEKLETYSLYLGGLGTRTDPDTNKFYEYKGIYNTYLDTLDVLGESERYQNIMNGDAQNAVAVKEILYGTDGLYARQSQWWKNLYLNYSWLIRENNYEDNSQITSSGLYAAAVKQFYNYNHPLPSYSASYINTDSLLDTDIPVKLGDSVLVYQPELFNKDDKQKLILQVPRSWDYSTNQLYFVSTSNRKYPVKIDDIITDNSSYILYCSCREEIDVKDIQYFYVGNQQQRITNVFYQQQSQPVKLRISGITYDLRTNVNQLTVEDYNLLNTVIDKLLYMIK